MESSSQELGDLAADKSVSDIPPTFPDGAGWWNDPWTRVREAWRYVRPLLGKQVIPAWYCAYVGVPQWNLRQRIGKLNKLDPRRCKMAMLARANYALDFGIGDPTFRDRYLRTSSRLLPYWRRTKSAFPIYESGHFPIMGGDMVNLTFTMRPGYDLVGALVRTMRKLVHLCHLYELACPREGLSG